MLIAIRLPDKIEERILSFPFLHTLRKFYLTQLEEEEQLELHLITKEEGIEVLYLLPFNAFYHPLNNEDNHSVLDAYRAYKNLKINKKIDIFYNLNLNFFDALLGVFFMAKKRVGFNKGNAQYLYSEKIPFQEGIHLQENYLTFLPRKEEEALPLSRKLPRIEGIPPEAPYIVINLDLNNKGEIHSDWYEFLTYFEKRKIVLLCDSLALGEQAYVLQGLINNLGENHNQIEVFQIENYIEVAQLLSHALIFVSYNSPLVYISTYCGTKTLLLNEEEKVQELAPLDFSGPLILFSNKDPSLMEGGRFNLEKVFNEIDGLWPR